MTWVLTFYFSYAVKLQNSKAGIQYKQITIKIAGSTRMWYQSYSSGDATGYVNGKSILSCGMPQSSSNPVYGSASKTVWLSELAAM